MWKYHGLPIKIISDRDSKFTSKFWSTLWSLLGTQLATSTAYSPQTDGQTERLNRTLEQFVRIYTDEHSQNWSQLLTPAEFAYNSVKHTSTGKSPFELDCGRRPTDPMFMFKSAAKQYSESGRVINSLDDYLRQLVNSWTKARNALEIAQHTMKKYYDKHHTACAFFVGQEAYMSTKREKDFKLIKFGSSPGSRKF